MLEEMSQQVFRRLAPADGDLVLDLGCGVGAPARALIARNSVAVTALTRVPWQIEMAHALGPGTAPRGTVEWLLADYTATGLPSTSYQGAFSIEASCHAAGVDKELFGRECARLLVPGARLVVADGFMRRSDGMPRWYAALLRFMTRSWAVECFADLNAFTTCLERQGFAVESTENRPSRAARSPVLFTKTNLVQTKQARTPRCAVRRPDTCRQSPARTVRRTTAQPRRRCAPRSAIRDCRVSSARHRRTECGGGIAVRRSPCSGLRARRRRTGRRRVG